MGFLPAEISSLGISLISFTFVMLGSERLNQMSVGNSWPDLALAIAEINSILSKPKALSFTPLLCPTNTSSSLRNRLPSPLVYLTRLSLETF